MKRRTLSGALEEPNQHAAGLNNVYQVLVRVPEVTELL